MAMAFVLCALRGGVLVAAATTVVGRILWCNHLIRTRALVFGERIVRIVAGADLLAHASVQIQLGGLAGLGQRAYRTVERIVIGVAVVAATGGDHPGAFAIVYT